MQLPESEYMEKPKSIPEGDNIMLVDVQQTAAAFGGRTDAGGATKAIGANTAKAGFSSFDVVMHESGHMLGFDERYTLGGLASLPGDIMAATGAGKQIAPVHFGDLARFALFTTINGQVNTSQTISAGVSVEAPGYNPAAMGPQQMMESGPDPSVTDVHREK
jgi:hypothetical protein